MISKLHDRLGTAGLVIAVVALVAALGGTAFAAAGLNSTQKKEVKKIAKQFAGQPGAPGQAGPQGAKGDPGAVGAKGSDGTNGTDGTDGVSITTANASLGECEQGGFKWTSSNGTGKICNGKEGSPWAAGGVLPSGETETGSWGGAVTKSSYVENGSGELEEVPGGGTGFFPISITIPLAEDPAPILVKPGETNVPGCPGLDAGGTPQAEEGKLCVYASAFVGTIEGPGFFDPTQALVPGAAPSGTEFGYECKTASCITYGTWAVTAE